jgi:hypothetical protein
VHCPFRVALVPDLPLALSPRFDTLIHVRGHNSGAQGALPQLRQAPLRVRHCGPHPDHPIAGSRGVFICHTSASWQGCDHVPFNNRAHFRDRENIPGQESLRAHSPTTDHAFGARPVWKLGALGYARYWSTIIATRYDSDKRLLCGYDPVLMDLTREDSDDRDYNVTMRDD